MESVDCVVVGAGVVGLAVARALALAGRDVIILDAAEGIGTETSSPWLSDFIRRCSMCSPGFTACGPAWPRRMSASCG